MKILPITVTEPTLAPLLASRLFALDRPIGALAELQPGDLLWLREPFYFKAALDHLSPNQAVELAKAVPNFAEGLVRGGAAMLGLGKRRAARTLPRALHRYHLAVTAIARRPLQAKPQAEMRAEGFASPAHWVDAWDRAAKAFKRASWSENPDVLRIEFALQRRPAPTGEEALS